MPINIIQHTPNIFVKHYIDVVSLEEMLNAQRDAAQTAKESGQYTYISILVLTHLRRFSHNVRGMLQGILNHPQGQAILVVDPPKGARVIVNMIQQMPLPIHIQVFNTLDEAIIAAEKLNEARQRSTA